MKKGRQRVRVSGPSNHCAAPSKTPTPTNTYPTDINLDGVVDAEDLLFLVEDWGSVSGAK
ncbi:MAG: hypothetical protein KC964_31360 [Candidatus Omnitrophica bacterium]|nr:hypothetical protein [Candidatus Omnitrophota bacterium]